MREPTTERPMSLPRSETWDTPTIPAQPARSRRHEAGEVEGAPRRRRRWWWRMADLSENTRIAIRLGSIAGVAVVLLWAGSWWGGLQSERAAVQAAQAAQHATDARQDEDIRQLRETIASINTNLALIKQGQEQSLPTLGRNSQYSIELLRDLETALAKQGIGTEKHGP